MVASKLETLNLIKIIPGHLNYFTPATVRSISSVSGFRVPDVNTSGLDVVEVRGGNKRILHYGD